MNKLFSGLILLISLAFPISNYANNTQVTTWTQDVLLNTLSLNYTDISTHFDKVKVNYTPTAWETLGSFLGDQVSVIRNNRLTLNPVPMGKAQIVTDGDYSGIHFWRINQSFDIPELNASVSFSVIVIKASTPPYLIQSLSMTKYKY